MDIYNTYEGVIRDTNVSHTWKSLFLIVAIGKSALAAMGLALAVAGMMDITFFAGAAVWYDANILAYLKEITLSFGVVGALVGLLVNFIVK